MDLPPLPATTILLVEVGSTAHGTGIPGGEDYDQLGVVVETPDEVLGLDERGFRTVMQRTQPDGVRSGPGDVDRTLHSLRRFVRLAASGNPSILMAFWAPVDHSAEDGLELQALGEAFVGRHVVPRYRGYMQSQAQRLLGTRGGGHGSRGGGGRIELIDAHGYDTKYAMHCARLGFQCQELLTTGELHCPFKVSRPTGCAPSAGARSRSRTGGPRSSAWIRTSPRSNTTIGSARPPTEPASSPGPPRSTNASGGRLPTARTRDRHRRAKATDPHQVKRELLASEPWGNYRGDCTRRWSPKGCGIGWSRSLTRTRPTSGR